MQERIGFIGLGVMGAPMAGHLLNAGFSVVTYDSDDTAQRAFCDEQTNAQRATSAAEVAARADVIFTMLPDGKQVQNVVFAESGLLSQLQQGSVLVDTSSSEPDLTRDTAARLQESNISMIDAATSGARWGAESAELVFMAGGDKQVLQRVQPLLDLMGKQTFHLGPCGAGHAMKSINNLITASTFLATAEGLALGTKLGLDPEAMTDVINQCTAMSWISQTHIKQRVLSRSFDDPFKLALMSKDMRVALDQAKAEQLSLPLSEQSHQQYRQAESAADTQASVSELVRWVERSTGVEIRKKTRFR